MTSRSDLEERLPVMRLGAEPQQNIRDIQAIITRASPGAPASRVARFRPGGAAARRPRAEAARAGRPAPDRNPVHEDHARPGKVVGDTISEGWEEF